MSKNQSKIAFTITTDENQIPEKIEWEGENKKSSESKAIMLSVWDKKTEVTERVDLWTKEMPVGEMKLFVYQSMLTSADALARSTGDEDAAHELRQFAHEWAFKQEIIKYENK